MIDRIIQTQSAAIKRMGLEEAALKTVSPFPNYSMSQTENTGRALPQCVILAGPNGSGKTSIFKRLALPGEFVNADEIAAKISGNRSVAGEGEAGKIAIKRLNNLLAKRFDFVFETTLSSNHSLSVIRKAYDQGFEVSIIFMALESAELNIKRVAERVAKGGHHVEDEVIRRRYTKSYTNLRLASLIAAETFVFDNSEDQTLLVMKKVDGMVWKTENFNKSNALHMKVQNAVRPMAPSV